MTRIQRHAIVPYTPRQMFVLVDNVCDYPAFLPWCVSANEIQRQGNMLEATIELAKGAVRKSFSTRNHNNPDEHIDISLLDGPFKKLEGSWDFLPLQDGAACKVLLDLEFEFSNRIMSAVLGPVFNTIANSLVDAFVARARVVYGD
ncbi:unnamed protein product [Cyprideis torosa]|uniref:Uncharacterized protein n=1 Tax=Cyprideis torosa TaxID=163714 RepID=A0A7R8X3I2_9CRUS|nr:unnamed protein product [Cyprideis torosa]CAG0912067.1 unnamed protein product [Cyprideis torosa]